MDIQKQYEDITYKLSEALIMAYELEKAFNEMQSIPENMKVLKESNDRLIVKLSDLS